MLIYSSPRLIAVSHVLLRLLMPRHSPYALFRLNFLNRSLRSIMRCPSSQIIFLRLCYSPYFALLAKFVVIFTPLRKDLLIFFSYLFIPRNKKVVFSKLSVRFFFLFIRFSMNCEGSFELSILDLRPWHYATGRPKWTRTTDLTLIRRAL